ncbi:hypothetical protein LQZ18_16265 [Lachnospiraceae bacterium ZAX-1]
MCFLQIDYVQIDDKGGTAESLPFEYFSKTGRRFFHMGDKIIRKPEIENITVIM